MPKPTTPVVTSTSKMFNINLGDFLKGLIMAVGGAVLTVIENSIEAGNFTFNWPNVWHVAVGALVVYLVKNLFTPGKTVISGMQPGDTTTITVPPPGTSTTVPPTGQGPVSASVGK
jgi:hypothetical protein